MEITPASVRGEDKHTYLETIPSFFARRRMESSDSPFKKTKRDDSEVTK